MSDDENNNLNTPEESNKTGLPNSNTDNNKSSDSSPESEFIPKDVLEQLPPEIRKIVSMQVSSIGTPRHNPIISKINEGHIDKILDLAGKDDERTHNDVREARKYNLFYVLISVSIFIFLTIFLATSNTDLYKEILKLFAIFAGGFGGGFGVKSYLDKRKY
jgi:hypothetical protein